jgi:hypothetical protein
MTNAFLPECLSNYCQGLSCIFFLFEQNLKHTNCRIDPLWNHIRPDTWLQIKGCKEITTSTPWHEIEYTDSKGTPVLSSTVASHYHNCCTDGSTSPGNYGYQQLYTTNIWFIQNWKSVPYTYNLKHFCSLDILQQTRRDGPLRNDWFMLVLTRNEPL